MPFTQEGLPAPWNLKLQSLFLTPSSPSAYHHIHTLKSLVTGDFWELLGERIWSGGLPSFTSHEDTTRYRRPLHMLCRAVSGTVTGVWGMTGKKLIGVGVRVL